MTQETLPKEPDPKAVQDFMNMMDARLDRERKRDEKERRWQGRILLLQMFLLLPLKILLGSYVLVCYWDWALAPVGTAPLSFKQAFVAIVMLNILPHVMDLRTGSHECQRMCRLLLARSEAVMLKLGMDLQPGLQDPHPDQSSYGVWNSVVSICVYAVALGLGWLLS